MAKFRQADAVGHRPTWKMGDRAAAAEYSQIDRSVFAEARAAGRRGGARQTAAERAAAADTTPWRSRRC